MSRVRATVVVAAGVIALGLVARVDAQPAPGRRGGAAARPTSRGADRPHRLLGVDRHAGLALADGDARAKATTKACR